MTSSESEAVRAQDNVLAIQGLAHAYARELDAQLGTLGLFTKHAGENGRVHEHFLRSVLRRFLPASLHVGSGFIALPAWTSTQFDIVVHQSSLAPLFAAGDLVVANGLTGVMAALEVKTRLDKPHLLGALEAGLDFKRQWRDQCRDDGGRQPFYGVYAAGGLSVETLLEHYREFMRSRLDVRDPLARRLLPDVIYIRGEYACIRDPGSSDPFLVLDIARVGDGAGLLSLVACLYARLGMSRLREVWWLDAWDYWNLRLGIEAGEPWGRMAAWSTRPAE